LAACCSGLTAVVAGPSGFLAAAAASSVVGATFGFLGFLVPVAPPSSLGTFGFLVLGFLGFVVDAALPGSATGSPAAPVVGVTCCFVGYLATVAPPSVTGVFGFFGFLATLPGLPGSVVVAATAGLVVFGAFGFLETLGLRPLLLLLPRVVGVVVVGSLVLPRSAFDSPPPLEADLDLDFDLLLIAAAPLAVVGLLPFLGTLGRALAVLGLVTLLLMGVFLILGLPTVLRRVFRRAAESW